jgi:hypothetical protein
MGNPFILYNGKTIDLGKLHRDTFPMEEGPPTVVNRTLTGGHETVTSPRVDISLNPTWLLETASLRRSLENWYQWAKKGGAFVLGFDSAKVVNTTIVIDAGSGANTVWVNNPSGITVAGAYRIIDGPNKQVVTVATASADKITINETLDFSLGAGALFRDEYYFVGVCPQGAGNPIQLHSGSEGNAWPPDIFYFSPQIIEDVSQEDTVLEKRLAADTAGTDTATAQDWFPSEGDVTVASDTTYEIEGQLRLSRSAGTTSHTTGLLFAGTATLTNITYQATCNTGDTAANAARNGIAAEVATETVVKAASTSATEQIAVWVRGTVRVTTGGTFIPQFKYSAAPGGAPSVLKNTYFRLIPLGSASYASQGTWS